MDGKTTKKKTAPAAEVKKAKTTVSDSALCYTLKVQMRFSKPPVWRRIQVPGSITLSGLKHVLLVIMGFDDSHLSDFIIDGQIYQGHSEDGGVFELLGRAKPRSCKYSLSGLITKPQTKFNFNYDYGDSWEYVITVEAIEPYPADVPKRVVCLAGKGNYFEDDIGGVGGYRYVVEVLSDPQSEDYEEYEEMHGTLQEFVRPFDVDTLNEALKSFRV